MSSPSSPKRSSRRCTARFDLGVKTLAQQVALAKAAGADVLVGYTVGPEFAVLAQARVEARFAGPRYGPWPSSLRTVADKAGPAVEGSIMVQTIIQDLSNERRASFIARLARSAGGRRPAGELADGGGAELRRGPVDAARVVPDRGQHLGRCAEGGA